MTARSIVLVVWLTAMAGCRGCQPTTPSWTAEEVSMSLASVPAQVCVAINDARPGMLREAGDSIHTRAGEEGWSRAQEEAALDTLHGRDAALREIVSPQFTRADGSRVQGSCRMVTETLVVLSQTVGEWEDFNSDDWRSSVAQTVRLVEDLTRIVYDLGIADLYGWLDEHVQIAGMGLGESLRTFLHMAEVLIEAGATGLREAPR